MRGIGAVVVAGLVSVSYHLGKSQRDVSELAIAQVSGPSCNYDRIRQVAQENLLLKIKRYSIVAIRSPPYSPGSTLDLVNKRIWRDARTARMMLTDESTYLDEVFADTKDTLENFYDDNKKF